MDRVDPLRTLLMEERWPQTILLSRAGLRLKSLNTLGYASKKLAENSRSAVLSKLNIDYGRPAPVWLTLRSMQHIYGAKQLAASFRTVRQNTVQIAEDIPEEKYTFTPAEGTRSVEQALAHIAVSTRMWQEAHASGATKM